MHITPTCTNAFHNTSKLKGHEATTKKRFGNKHPNLLYHGYGWRERERSPGTLTP
jgi:hypothetical protein